MPGDQFSNSKDGEGAGEKSKHVAIAEKKAVRVEPKSYFANERTFISWIHAGLLLLTVSTIMMGNENFLGTAAFTSFAAFFLVVYAAYVYFRRIHLLSSGKAYGYIDHAGPILLAISVSFGVGVVFVDNWGAWHGSTIFDSNSENGGGGDDRRLARSAALYEEPGKCFKQSMEGINRLKFQPLDLVPHTTRDELLVVSPHDILSYPLHGDKPVYQTKIHNAQLGGVSVVGDRMFALSGGPVQTELLELTWNFVHMEQMSVLNRWTLRDTASDVRGMMFVQNKYNHGTNEPSGELYMNIDGQISSYAVPSHDAISLSLLDNINMDLVNVNGEDDTSTMHYFDGVAYLLHSKREVLHAWDLDAGEFLGEIPLPHLDSGMSREWKGFSLERIAPMNDAQEERNNSLRGAVNNNSSSQSSPLMLHLTTDTPPQVWSIKLGSEDGSRGMLRLPECAGGLASASN